MMGLVGCDSTGTSSDVTDSGRSVSRIHRAAHSFAVGVPEAAHSLVMWDSPLTNYCPCKAQRRMGPCRP